MTEGALISAAPADEAPGLESPFVMLPRTLRLGNKGQGMCTITKGTPRGNVCKVQTAGTQQGLLTQGLGSAMSATTVLRGTAWQGALTQNEVHGSSIPPVHEVRE